MDTDTTNSTNTAVPPVDPAADPPLFPLPGPAPRGPRFLLRRSRGERKVAGVCGGIAEATGLDPVLVRLALVALTVFGAGSGLLFYLVAWVLVPEAE